MKMASISSGSKGNCIYVGNNSTSILVDTGISKKKIEEGLESLEMNPDNVNAILITHEHNDHIRGLGVLLRKYSIPVYGTEKTLRCILNEPSVGKIDSSLFYAIDAGRDFSIGDITILPVSVSHDAADPVCYKFAAGDKSCAVVTDLGEYDHRLVYELQNLNSILVESNHDVNMLQAGAYPYRLKQRIWGEKGHLSNETCGRLINEIISDKLKNIILGHLSAENNYPELAFEAVRNEINTGNTDFMADDINLMVAGRTEVSCVIDF